ncbi:MAG: hypothetical protein ACWGQW_05035 [bacterium]
MARNRGNPSGRVHRKHFLNQLIKDMGCIRPTAQRRLRKAMSLGFIEEEGDGYYSITGRNRMAELAFHKQKSAYGDKLSSFKPAIFFLDDRRYDIKAKNLIDPKDMNQTKSLLYGLMAIYGSRQLLSREIHADILGHKRDAAIKLSKKARVNETGTFLLIDPMSLLFQPDCTRTDAIEAFREAERLYRFGPERRVRVRGREIFQRRRVQEVTYLAVQLPNTFTSARIEKEVPVRFDSFMALLGPGEGASRVLSPDRTQKPRQAECPLPVGSDVDSYGGCKEQLLEGRDTFVNSWGLAGEVSLPDGITNRYLATVRDMLEDEECRNLILRATGAQNVRHFASSACRVWRGKAFSPRNTPVGVSVEESAFSTVSPC